MGGAYDFRRDEDQILVFSITGYTAETALDSLEKVIDFAHAAGYNFVRVGLSPPVDDHERGPGGASSGRGARWRSGRSVEATKYKARGETTPEAYQGEPSGERGGKDTDEVWEEVWSGIQSKLDDEYSSDMRVAKGRTRVKRDYIDIGIGSSPKTQRSRMETFREQGGKPEILEDHLPEPDKE